MKTESTLKKIPFLLTFGLLLILNGVYAQTLFEITSPSGIAGIYDMASAGFGGELPGCADETPVSGELIIGDDNDDEGGSGSTTDGCQAIVNDLTGKIAIIDRGACEFGVKCLNAENAGAILVIVCNNQATDIFSMGAGAVGDQVTIPALMISMADCATIRTEVPGATATISWSPIIPSDDVVLWDGGQFDGGFGDWTTIAISPDTAFWTWTPDGRSGNGNIVHSPSVCNGAAIFDANVYNAEAAGGAPPYPQHSGELISPVIDCSTFEFTSLKFYTHNLRLNGNTDFSVSIDGGTTWSDPTVIETENVFTSVETNLVGTEIKRYLISEFPGQANCRIKFTFNGDFYFFILDDVQLIEPERNNLVVMENFYAIAPNAVSPASQAEPFSFLADVYNAGAITQTGVNLNVTIEDNSGPVFSSDLPYLPIPPDSLVENIPFLDYFTSSGIPTEYNGTYEISSDSVDFDPSDNFRYFSFETSDTVFAKERGMTRTIVPAAGNWEGEGEPHSWAYGNFFYVVNGDNWWASSATFGIGNADAPGIAGRLITIYLYKWDADSNEDGNMDPDERTRVGFFVYEITGDELPTDLITVPLLNFPSGDPGPVELDSDQAYVIMVEYNINDEVDFALVASDVIDYGAMAFRSEINGGIPAGLARYAGMLGVNGDLESEAYSSIGFGRDLVPVVRLNIQQPTSIEETLDASNLIEISPNPADNKINLNIELVETQERVSIRIFDVNGRMIMDQPYENMKNESFEFDVSDYTSGAYFLHFITENGVRTERFIVQH
jgi:PA domain/Secretion system C-terminal sorting domain